MKNQSAPKRRDARHRLHREAPTERDPQDSRTLRIVVAATRAHPHPPIPVQASLEPRDEPEPDCVPAPEES